MTKSPAQLSKELLERYHGARSEWANNALEDDLFRNNVQWKPDEAKILEGRNQFAIVVNVIYHVVEQAKALLTANKPRFTSTAREDSDTRIGKVFSDLLAYIWDISGGNGELKQIVDDYYVRGMGVWFAYTDPFADGGRGEVYVKSLDPFNVYFDPAATDRFCRDSGHILISRILSESQFKQYYPGFVKLLAKAEKTTLDRHPSSTRIANEGQQIGTPIRDTVEAYYEVIDRYSKEYVQRFEVYNTVDGLTQQFTLKEAEEYFARPVIAMQNPQGQMQYITAPEQLNQIQQLVMAGQIDPSLVQPGTMQDLYNQGLIKVLAPLVPRIARVMSVGGEIMYDDYLEVDEYPVVPVMNRFNRNPYPMSDVRFARPIQEYINKIRSLIVAHATNSTNQKWWVPRGSTNLADVRNEINRAGTAVMEYDAEFGKPISEQPLALPNELYKNEADAKADIERIFGIYAMMQGDAQSAPNTYRGIVSIDEYGQRRIKSKRDDIEDAINQLAKVVIQMIQKTYTHQKVVRLIQPTGAPRELAINVPLYDDLGSEIGKFNDITIGKYDVIVVSGSTLPSNRWARFEYYMELYKAGIIDQIEVLKQTEVADMEGVLNRHNAILQLQQQLAAAQEQIKKLQGDLQTAERESKHDRMRVEVEKFKTGLKTSQNRAEMATKLFDARLQDQLKMQKAEAAAEQELVAEQEEPMIM